MRKMGGDILDDRVGFGSRIKALRELRGLTIEQTAEKCDSSASAWRQYEKGQRLPSLSKLKIMCLVLREKPEYFFGSELDALLDDMNGTEKLKAKIAQLQPDDIEVIDAAVSKRLELRNQRGGT